VSKEVLNIYVKLTMKVVFDQEAMSDLSVTLCTLSLTCLLSPVTTVKRACRGDMMREDSNVDCAINSFFNICFVWQSNDVISLSVESKNVNKLEL